MIPTIQYEMTNDHEEALERLAKFEDALRRKAVQKGLAEAGKPVANIMRGLFPARSGRLRRSVGRSQISGRAARRLDLFGGSAELKPDQLAVLIGPNKRVSGKRRAGAANILEGGAKRHTIRPRERGGILRLGRRGFARAVKHPGVRARRYMELALQQGEAGLIDRFYLGMERELDRI